MRMRKSISKLILGDKKQSLSVPPSPAVNIFTPKPVNVQKHHKPTMADLNTRQKGLNRDATVYNLGRKKKRK